MQTTKAFFYISNRFYLRTTKYNLVKIFKTFKHFKLHTLTMKHYSILRKKEKFPSPAHHHNRILCLKQLLCLSSLKHNIILHTQNYQHSITISYEFYFLYNKTNNIYSAQILYNIYKNINQIQFSSQLDEFYIDFTNNLPNFI